MLYKRLSRVIRTTWVVGAILAVTIVVLFVAVLAAAHTTSPQTPRQFGAAPPLQCSPVSYGDTVPSLEADVPDVLPCNGVNVNNQVVLLPAPAVTGIETDQQALSSASADQNAANRPCSIVLADLTVVGTLASPITTDPTREVRDKLVWVVTFTLPQPYNPVQGGVGHTGGPGNVVSHSNVAVDAVTGAFVLGFYTK